MREYLPTPQCGVQVFIQMSKNSHESRASVSICITYLSRVIIHPKLMGEIKNLFEKLQLNYAVLSLAGRT